MLEKEKMLKTNIVFQPLTKDKFSYLNFFWFVVSNSVSPFVQDFIFITCCSVTTFHSLPHDKILDWLKAFADDKINVTKTYKSVSGREENIVGKGYQHFLLFSQCFQKASYTGSLKAMIVW